MSYESLLDEDPHNETLEENKVRGGFLSRDGRSAAIQQSLPLVGRYFQSQGSFSGLSHRAAIARAETPSTADERLLAGLRLRAALATSERILRVLEEVVRRPTFRYTLTQAESVGALEGILDLTRYVARMPLGGGPPVYPILDVRRSSVTPENIMCSYAALWMRDEVCYALDASDAGAESPEAALAEDLAERFLGLLAVPVLKEVVPDARDILWRSNEDQLLERTEERLRRGEISNAGPYQELLEILLELKSHGPSGDAGDAVWSFYDDSFDARLFELWCLYRLATAVSDVLAVDPAEVQPEWSGGGLTFRWLQPKGTLELHYQRSLTTIMGEGAAPPRWRRANDGNTLRGIPDIIAKADTLAGPVNVAILDAKLRQRTSAPTEELYKVLGYFNNFALEEAPCGAILHHSPQAAESLVYSYEDRHSGGTLLATALNPARYDQAQAGLMPVAEMCVRLLG